MMLPMVPRNEDEATAETDVALLALENLRFPQPPLGIAPKNFVETHFGAGARSMQFRKGTTMLAFIYEAATQQDQGGVIVAADSRASSGAFISSKSVLKVLDLDERLVATMAGGAADCQYWTRVVRKYCSLYKLRERESITVDAASKYFANVLYNYRGKGLSVGSMVAGFDKHGPAVVMVTSEGARVPLRVCAIGSGSLSAYSILDVGYKARMTDEEARQLGRNAICHATYRDSGSGGVVNLVHITPTEKIRFPGVDVSKLWYEFADEIGRDIAFEPRE